VIFVVVVKFVVIPVVVVVVGFEVVYVQMRVTQREHVDSMQIYVRCTVQ
jgi:hypothetical protein